MAQGVRTRRQLAAPAGGALALLAAACSRGTPLPEEAAAALDVLLVGWHGPLRGNLDRITTELRAGGPDGALRTIDLDGPRLRVRAPDGTVEVLAGDAAWHAGPGRPPSALSASEHDTLVLLRDLVAAAYLVPVYGARSVAWGGPAELVLGTAEGASWRLAFDPDTRLPRRFTGPPGEVRFVSFLSTGITELPAEVDLGRLGRQHLKLLAHGVRFEPAVFFAPAASAPQPRPVTPADPAQPELATLEGRTVLVLDDPGDWPTRLARVAGAGRALAEQGQVNAGLPFLFVAGDRPRLGLPFAAAAAGRTFVPRPGDVVEQRPPQRAVILVRPKGEFAASCAAGTRAVHDFAARHRLTASGPLRVLPFLAWDRGTPAVADLAAVKVRFELPVEPGK